MSEPQPLRSIAIVGAGLTGLSAAALFARTLPQVAVTLIDCPADPAALADRMPGALPALHRFHEEIGFDPGAFASAAFALPRLGTRFSGWGPAAGAWIHSFGQTGRPLGTTPFHHFWMRAVAGGGGAEPYHRYSVAGRLAESERFDPAAAASGVEWGLSFDPDAYRERLGAHCAALGVRRLPGNPRGVELGDEERIAALRLDGDRTIEADLFVDGSGPQALLLTTLSSEFESWGAWLPGGDFVLRQSEGRPRLCDEAFALDGGWCWRAPMPHGALECRFGTLAWAAEGGERLTLRPGRRPRPWIGNVLALGDAACAIDPLHAVNLHLAQSGARLALALLPDRRFGAAETAEYNRRVRQEAERVRDFLALHHLARERRLHDAPQTLSNTIEQFARRGRLPFHEGETFGADSWTTAFLNLGVRPALSGAIAGRHGPRTIHDLLAATGP